MNKQQCGEIERSLLFLVQRIKSLSQDIENSESRIVFLEKNISVARGKISKIEAAKTSYKIAVEKVYADSLGSVEETINAALRFIFHDKKYSSKLEVGDNRSKTLDLILYDYGYDPPRIVDMKMGVGNGVRTVVSFILLVYYMVSMGRVPLIFADEAYSAISAEYVGKFFEFVSSICKEKGSPLVLITHDLRFTPYADKRYSVNEGVVREITHE